MRDNHTKRLLAGGEPAFGVSLTIGDPFVAELVGGAGLDFVMIDAQHAPLPVDSLQAMLIAMRTSPSTLLVCTAGNDATVIGQILDIGAEGVIVPDVTDRNSCLAAVSAARYAPAGSRSGRVVPPRLGTPTRRGSRRPARPWYPAWSTDLRDATGARRRVHRQR